METVAEQLSFSAIAAEDLDTFYRQKEKILTATIEKISNCTQFDDIVSDGERMRLARECTSIFTENFHATAKYNLPQALLEYLDWLRNFLRHRNFPATFIPTMICALRHATHAFMENANSDAIASVLMQLQRHERTIAEEVTA